MSIVLIYNIQNINKQSLALAYILYLYLSYWLYISESVLRRVTLPEGWKYYNILWTLIF